MVAHQQDIIMEDKVLRPCFLEKRSLLNPTIGSHAFCIGYAYWHCRMSNNVIFMDGITQRKS